MAVSTSAYKIIKKAVQIRMNRGESFEEIIISYPKLSTEQINQLREELE